MDFNLSDDQAAFQEAARRFAADKLAPNAADWDRDAHFPTDIMREAAELGFAGIYVREDVGGLKVRL